MFKDDNERLMAGVLPTDPFEGTVPFSSNRRDKDGTEQVDPRERLRTEGLTLTELLQIEFPPTVWLVEGLLQESSTHCLFGPPNSGKTFLAFDMIMKLLRQGKRVTLYEAEGSGKDLQQRLRRALAAHQIEHPEYLRIFHNAEIDLTTEVGMAAVFAHAKEHQPDLIVFDSLAAMAGSIDENDAASMIQLSNVLNRIKAEICALLALHHMNKDGWIGDTPTLRTLRGHSSLPGRLDVALAVLPVEAETTDLELVFDVFEVKRRDEPKAKPRRCRIAMPASGDAATLELVEIDGSAARKEEGLHRAEVMKEQMVEAVRTSMPIGLTTTELRVLVSGRNDMKADSLRDLLTAGKLDRRQPARGERGQRIVLGLGIKSSIGAA